MSTKLALTAAAALLAGTVFAAAQQAPRQPGGAVPQDPPQGAEGIGSQGASPKAGGNMNRGTTGQGTPNSRGSQPGGVSKSAPPQGGEDTGGGSAPPR